MLFSSLKISLSNSGRSRRDLQLQGLPCRVSCQHVGTLKELFVSGAELPEGYSRAEQLSSYSVPGDSAREGEGHIFHLLHRAVIGSALPPPITALSARSKEKPAMREDPIGLHVKTPVGSRFPSSTIQLS